MEKKYYSEKEMTKKFNFYIANTVKCKCGHSVTITNKYKRLICSWCGRFVYIDPKEEFKDKMKGLLKVNE